jgi:hypothetical protein
LTGITNFGRKHIDKEEDDEILDILVADLFHEYQGQDSLILLGIGTNNIVSE